MVQAASQSTRLSASGRRATLYRTVMPNHTCPHGRKAKALLERRGFRVDDHPLRSREEIDAIKADHGVKTVPLALVDGEKVGGYSDLLAYFGRPVPDPNRKTYTPVLALFAVAALLAVALNAPALTETPGNTLIRMIEQFIAGSMVMLGLQKLRNLESFASQFLNYDLLAQRRVRYAYVYPFAEAGAGILMFAGLLPWLAAPVGLFIASVGAVSVIKAVYIDRRELKCACVGGNSNVPLGAVSLTENLMMMGMALWMFAKMGLGLG
ncbi:MAG: MauE/DoxX family redox-associated membrane protein [Alphaproteobacteria bacterium]